MKTLMKEVWKLNHKTNHQIQFTVEKDVQTGKLSVKNHQGEEEFVFRNSNPDMVKMIAELLLEASKL